MRFKKCLRCGYEWYPRKKEIGIFCPTCELLNHKERIEKELQHLNKDLPPEFSETVDKHFWELF